MSCLVRGGCVQAGIRIKSFPPVAETFNTKRDALLWTSRTEDEIRRGVYDALTAFLVFVTKNRLDIERADRNRRIEQALLGLLAEYPTEQTVAFFEGYNRLPKVGR